MGLHTGYYFSELQCTQGRRIWEPQKSHSKTEPSFISTVCETENSVCVGGGVVVDVCRCVCVDVCGCGYMEVCVWRWALVT